MRFSLPVKVLLGFAKGSDPDQVRQNVGQTFDTLMVFLLFFLLKVTFGRQQQKREDILVYAESCADISDRQTDQRSDLMEKLICSFSSASDITIYSFLFILL